MGTIWVRWLLFLILKLRKQNKVMKDTLKKILRPLVPKIAKNVYKRLTTNLDNYYLLPKKDILYTSEN